MAMAIKNTPVLEKKSSERFKFFAIPKAKHSTIILNFEST